MSNMSNKNNKNNKNKKKLWSVLLVSLCVCFAAVGGASAQEADTERAEPVEQVEPVEMVEIEYNGKIISVDMRDMILVRDEEGNQSVELGYPEKYSEALSNARFYGLVEQYADKNEETEPVAKIGQDVAPDEDADYRDDFPAMGGGSGSQEISQREYEEEQRARVWAEVVEDLTLRDIDRKALELVKEFGSAKDAVPPMTGTAGSVVVAYSSYTPKIVCRPMYVTDVILQPGEVVTGVHPGDPVRWTFVPSQSGAGDAVQTHVLIKPLMADISTNLVINTDRRTYQLDLVSSATNFVPSVSFSYPADTLKEWDSFIARKQQERQENTVLATGYTVNPEDLHLNYEIRGKDALRWKPVRVWDDGVKTYIQFKPGSVKKSVEAPVFVVYEHKKQVIANYRATDDMYVVDRVFDKAALIVGTGAHQDRVVLTRLR
ncbi:P-type conjugative transfer protein TrbG [Synergistaceae bacterium OttesenSCG-928-I11]|nr:P-type conjugative transfer protein TrbG [Synergistaceae bacterium OttesenSCG-928-I11]